MVIEPVTIIAGAGMRTIVLTQSRELVDMTNNDEALAGTIADKSWYELKGWRIVRRCSTNYQGDRVVHDCLGDSPGKEGELVCQCRKIPQGLSLRRKRCGKPKKRNSMMQFSPGALKAMTPPDGNHRRHGTWKQRVRPAFHILELLLELRFPE
jgi:hypothetical protein